MNAFSMPDSEKILSVFEGSTVYAFFDKYEQENAVITCNLCSTPGKVTQVK